MIHQQNSPQPWYVKKKTPNTELHPSHKPKNNFRSPPQSQESSFAKFKTFCYEIFPSFLALVCFVATFACLFSSFFYFQDKTSHMVLWSLSIVCAVLGCLCLLHQIGSVCSYFAPKYNDNSRITVALKFLQGEIQREEPRTGIPAPEMALYQFVQQVRSYATEKSFLKQKNDKNTPTFSQNPASDNNIILKRRWNDVMDSLNEFEIYLANDPTGIIEKLVAKSPLQNTDVSQIFRDVAETFDTTWRRKGIQIEQAIVTPLKANTNEALLRRLLVGPWRSCVYFARRGNEVIFTAKSNNGKIIAHWECEGVVYPEEFFHVVGDSSLSVNERIEKGMVVVGSDPGSPNMLFALISFVTWIDLANASGSDYTIKQGSEGLIIELRI